MKKIISLLVVLMLSFSAVLPVYAAQGRVVYDGNAQAFLFEPGSEHSPTDLFPNFKGVMPGDSLTQTITVKNDASRRVKVKIYLCALGADVDSVAFLSQLNLRVQKSEEPLAYLFDATADQTAQLTDWVCLGTLYSGGEVDLNVILDVPAELDNRYSSQVGFLDWEFMVEEFPIEETDPKPPQTGDDTSIGLWFAILICAAAMMLWTVFLRNRKQNI